MPPSIRVNRAPLRVPSDQVRVLTQYRQPLRFACDWIYYIIYDTDLLHPPEHRIRRRDRQFATESGESGGGIRRRLMIHWPRQACSRG